MNPIAVHHAGAFIDDPGLGAPARTTLAVQGVDSQVVIPGLVHVSLWWQAAPPLAGERVGVIGHVRAAASADASAMAHVLDAACRTLREAGCTIAIGPMDGNTWRTYRFVTWSGGEPRFALEPAQPAVWPAWWLAAGFAAYEDYWSALVQDLRSHDVRLEGAWQRLLRQGVALRAFDPGQFDEELQRIFAVSEVAFRGNVLYTPLPLADFIAMYQGIRAIMRPELCLIAERGRDPVGFIFAIPDYEQARCGQPVDTLVVKTLAVVPGRDFAGLGKILLERCQHSAYEAGFRRAVHALMHQSNGSRNLGDLAQEIRRYTLFSRRL